MRYGFYKHIICYEQEESKTDETERSIWVGIIIKEKWMCGGIKSEDWNKIDNADSEWRLM